MNFEGQTLFSPLTIKVLLVPIGNIPAAVFSQYAAEIRRHASMDLQSLATYDDLSSNKSLLNRNWVEGRVWLDFVHHSDAAFLRNSEWEQFSFSRRPFALIGLLHCPSCGSLADAYKSFTELCKRYPRAARTRCFAFEPLDSHVDHESAQHPDLVMFPHEQPALHESDSSVSRLRFYLSTLLTDLCAYILTDIDKTIATIEDIKFFSNPLEHERQDMDPVRARKLRVGRAAKFFGDCCLMAGAHKTAVYQLRLAVEQCSLGADFMWQAAALESLATATIASQLEETIYPHLNQSVHQESRLRLPVSMMPFVRASPAVERPVSNPLPLSRVLVDLVSSHRHDSTPSRAASPPPAADTSVFASGSASTPLGFQQVIVDMMEQAVLLYARRPRTGPLRVECLFKLAQYHAMYASTAAPTSVVPRSQSMSSRSSSVSSSAVFFVDNVPFVLIPHRVHDAAHALQRALQLSSDLSAQDQISLVMESALIMSRLQLHRRAAFYYRRAAYLYAEMFQWRAAHQLFQLAASTYQLMFKSGESTLQWPWLQQSMLVDLLRSSQQLRDVRHSGTYASRLLRWGCQSYEAGSLPAESLAALFLKDADQPDQQSANDEGVLLNSHTQSMLLEYLRLNPPCEEVVDTETEHDRVGIVANVPLLLRMQPQPPMHDRKPVECPDWSGSSRSKGKSTADLLSAAADMTDVDLNNLEAPESDSDSADGDEDENVFLFNPNRKSDDAPASRMRWICGEPCYLDVWLCNPLSVLLQIDRMSVRTEFSSPDSVCQRDIDDVGISVSLPPLSHNVRVSVPVAVRSPGTLTLRGIDVHIGKWHQFLSVDHVGCGLDVCGTHPAAALLARSSAIDALVNKSGQFVHCEPPEIFELHSMIVEPALPLIRASVSTLQAQSNSTLIERGHSLYHHEKVITNLTIENIGSESIAAIRLDIFHISSKQASFVVNPSSVVIASYIFQSGVQCLVQSSEISVDKAQFQCPLLPGHHIRVPVHVLPVKGTTGLEFRLTYSSDIIGTRGRQTNARLEYQVPSEILLTVCDNSDGIDLEFLCESNLVDLDDAIIFEMRDTVTQSTKEVCQLLCSEKRTRVPFCMTKHSFGSDIDQLIRKSSENSDSIPDAVVDQLQQCWTNYFAMLHFTWRSIKGASGDLTIYRPSLDLLIRLLKSIVPATVTANIVSVENQHISENDVIFIRVGVPAQLKFSISSQIEGVLTTKLAKDVDVSDFVLVGTDVQICDGKGEQHVNFTVLALRGGKFRVQLACLIDGSWHQCVVVELHARTS